MSAEIGNHKSSKVPVSLGFSSGILSSLEQTFGGGSGCELEK